MSALKHDGDPLPGSPSPPIILWSAHGRVGRGPGRSLAICSNPVACSKVATIRRVSRPPAIGTQLVGQLRLPRGALHRPGAWRSCRSWSPAHGRCARSAHGTRSRRSPTAPSWSLWTACRGEIWSTTTPETVSVAGDTTYAELAEALNREGLALHNLASLPHISVAGAIATGTHGSGDRKGNLATAVRGACEMVGADGELRTLHIGDPGLRRLRRRPGCARDRDPGDAGGAAVLRDAPAGVSGGELGHAVRALRRDLRRRRERERLSPVRRADRAGLGQAAGRRLGRPE